MPSARWPPTLRQLLGGTYLAATLLLAIGVVYALGRHLDDHFRRELLDRGHILVERLTEDSRLALIQSESDSLRPRLETALVDPNVAGIVVATARGPALVAAGQNPVLSSLSLSIDTMKDAPQVVETAGSVGMRVGEKHSVETPDTMGWVDADGRVPPRLAGIHLDVQRRSRRARHAEKDASVVSSVPRALT